MLVLARTVNKNHCENARTVVSALCVCAGEGHLMSWDEHIMLIAHTVNVYGDRLKVRQAAVCSSREPQQHHQQQQLPVMTLAASLPAFEKLCHQLPRNACP